MTGRRALEVLRTGALALLQDEGRVGLMSVGVGRSGAADHGAHALANRLVGNRPGQATVEVTLGGLRVRAHGEVYAALTGAPSGARVDGRPVAHCAVVAVPSGSELMLGLPEVGLRTYLAVRGGFDVEPVLGSRSTDTMSGLGPPPLAVGMVLPVGTAAGPMPRIDHAPVSRPESGEVTVRVTPGPRHDWFADPHQLGAVGWTVSERSDRRGVRLVGGSVQRHPDVVDIELPSEGMVRGAIQVPPNGEPVILLGDHPVTGGYPVIGVVRTPDVDRVAQLVPGQAVRLLWEGRR